MVRENPSHALLERLKLGRLHITPDALDLSPAATRRRYPHIFAPLDELLTLLRPLPPGLLNLWLQCPRGHVLLSHLETAYREGKHELKTSTIEAVAYVRVADLSQDRKRALQVVAQLLDHLMGSSCEPDGPRLSDGVGVVPRLANVGRRLAECIDLGYLAPAGKKKPARDYFAIAFADYLVDPRRMNVLDPLTHKLLHRSLMSESFWTQEKGGS